MVLQLPAAEAGVAPSAEHREVWAVIVDLTHREGTATLVAMADGTASLYSSAGGAVTTGAEAPRVARTADRLLSLAEWLLDGIPPATSFPLPGPGAVAVHVRTYDGGHSVSITEEDLAAGGHELSTLYFATHRLLDELRRVEATGG